MTYVKGMKKHSSYTNCVVYEDPEDRTGEISTGRSKKNGVIMSLWLSSQKIGMETADVPVQSNEGGEVDAVLTSIFEKINLFETCDLPGGKKKVDGGKPTSVLFDEPFQMHLRKWCRYVFSMASSLEQRGGYMFEYSPAVVQRSIDTFAVDYHGDPPRVLVKNFMDLVEAVAVFQLFEALVTRNAPDVKTKGVEKDKKAKKAKLDEEDENRDSVPRILSRLEGFPLASGM